MIKKDPRTHDSRRYLKHHPPRRSNRYFQFPPEKVWRDAAERALARWNALAAETRQNFSAQNYRTGRCGASPEQILCRDLPKKRQELYDTLRAAKRETAKCAGNLEPAERDYYLRRAVAYQLGYRGAKTWKS